MRYFALNRTDHRSHAEQDAAIATYVQWRNAHANRRRTSGPTHRSGHGSNIRITRPRLPDERLYEVRFVAGRTQRAVAPTTKAKSACQRLHSAKGRAIRGPRSSPQVRRAVAAAAASATAASTPATRSGTSGGTNAPAMTIGRSLWAMVRWWEKVSNPAFP